MKVGSSSIVRIKIITILVFKAPPERATPKGWRVRRLKNQNGIILIITILLCEFKTFMLPVLCGKVLLRMKTNTLFLPYS